jgi:hypothetical protein
MSVMSLLNEEKEYLPHPAPSVVLDEDYDEED